MWNSYNGPLATVDEGMQCGMIPKLLPKLICKVLQKAVQGMRGLGTVAGVVAGGAACDVSYKAEIEACYTVHGPILRPGPKW